MSGKKTESEGFEIHEFHRDELLDEDGVSQVVLERFLNYRLPFLIQVKREMDEGRVLTSGELEMISRWVAQTDRLSSFVYQHPQFKELVAKVVGLIHDIADEALRNEINSSS